MSADRIRVLHVIPTFGRGGAEKMAADLLAGLDRRRFEAAAVSLAAPTGAGFELALARAGVPVRYLGKRRGFAPAVYPALDRVFEAFRPDVVHTHQYVLPYVLPLIAAWRTPAAFHTVHNLAEREVGAPYRAVHRLAFWLGVRPVAIAREVARTMEAVYGLRDLPLVPNAIPVAAFRAPDVPRAEWRAREGFAPTDVLITNVARLTAQKEQATLVWAFATGLGSHPHARLLLVGDGELRAELEALVERLGIGPRVRFMGVRADVPDVLAASDVFALSSAYEGNPLCVMEAMAAGLPVVATSVGGVPELITPGEDGLLVAPRDAARMARALATLVADAARRRRMARCAARHAEERFDLPLMVRAYEDLYAGALRAPAAVAA